MKIYVTLMLTVSLGSFVHAQRRRFHMTQYREGAARSSDTSHLQEQERYDPRNQYPTSPRTIDQSLYQTSPSPRTLDHNQYQTSPSPRTLDHNQYQTSPSPRTLDHNQYQTNPSPRTLDRNQYQTNPSPRTLDQSQYQTSPKSVENYHYETSQRNYDYEQYQTSPRQSDRNQYQTTARSPVDYYATSPRTVEVSNHYPTNSRTVEVSNHYPTNPRAVETESRRNKYRRKPKQTYYPKVVSFYQKPTPNNGYEFKYVTADGVQRAERGYLSDKGVWTVEGSVTSLDNDNVAVVQSYIADAAGYKSSIRRHSAGTFRSLDDFLPWAYENEHTDVRLGELSSNSLAVEREEE